MDPVSAPSAPRRAALVFIFVTVLLDMLALGMIIPVLPRLVLGFVGNDTARAVPIYGYFATVWALAQFVSAPILGALSDRHGRRPVVLLSNLGLGFDYVLMALAPSLSWLFAGRLISGITSASIPTAGAYLADVTAPEERARAFGMLGAAFGLGFVLGPAVGGLLGQIAPRLPFWVAAGFSLANAGYGLFVLPESLPIERRGPFRWRRANPLGSLRLLRSHPELFGLAGVSFLAVLAHEVLPSTFVLYTGYRYGWTERTVGLVLGCVGLCSAVVQSVLVKNFVARFGERRAVLTGLLFGTVGFAAYGLAPTGPWFWAGVPVMALWGLSNPAVQSLMSRRVAAAEQGQLQGATGSLRGISGLIGPTIFTFAFSTAIGPGRDWNLPGAAFLLSSLLLLCAAGLAVILARPLKVTPPLAAARTEAR